MSDIETQTLPQTETYTIETQTLPQTETYTIETQTLPQAETQADILKAMADRIENLESKVKDWETKYEQQYKYFLNSARSFGIDAAPLMCNQLWLCNNDEQLKYMLAHGALITRQDPISGKSILHNIVDYPDSMELFIKYGADVNAREKSNNMTPLMMAANKNNIESVAILVTSGADINLRDNAGKTALFYAVNYPSVLRYLLTNGADANIKDNKGRTVLYYAKRKNANSFYLLLEYGYIDTDEDTERTKQNFVGRLISKIIDI